MTLQAMRSWHTAGQRHATLLAQEERALMSGWLGTLDEQLAADLLRHSAAWHVPARQVLADRGAVPDVWFGVAAGAVLLGACSPCGRESALDVLEPGQWFGDMPLLCGSAQPYTAHTLSPCTLLVMRRSTLRQLLGSHASLATALAQLNWERCSRLMERVAGLAELNLLDRTRRQLQVLRARGLSASR